MSDATTPAVVTGHAKIIKPRNAPLSEIELLAAKMILEVETQCNIDALKELYIMGARNIQFAKGKEALIVYVPVSLLKKFKDVHHKLISEMEQRLGHYVIILGWRRILPKPHKKNKIKQIQKRPRNRTVTHVHEAMMHDLVFPLDIVGKRTRVKLDGSKLIKIHLDHNPDEDDRIEAFSLIYEKLTGKKVIFEFPEYIL